MYENFVGTLKTVRNREVSILETYPYQEVLLYQHSEDTYCGYCDSGNANNKMETLQHNKNIFLVLFSV